MSESFIVFDDFYLVELAKAFTTEDNNYICFILANNIGIFKFKRPSNNIVAKKSWLGRFLHLGENKKLSPRTIIEIVSTCGAIDSYIVPKCVRFIPNKKNKRRIPYE